MGEGKGRMFFKNSNVELDYIIEELLNNEEFLSRVADKISRDYLGDKEICSGIEELDIEDLDNVAKENKCWIEQANVDHSADKYVKQIENLNIENKELVREKDRLLKEINSLRQEVKDLKNKQNDKNKHLNELKQTNEDLREKLTILENKHNKVEANMKYSLEKKDEDLYNKKIELIEKDKRILQQQSEIKELQYEFSSIKESYNLFLSLNDEIKEDMVSILRGDKIENFVYAGVQYKNIESIWEYAKNRAINGQLEDLDKLEKIIMNFLDAYNMTYNSPLYEVQRVENGDDFDEEKFIRGYESRITGVISGVDLLGYVNLVNGKIIKKSVVRI